MQSAARNLDPYVVPLVSLAPVSDEQQTDENLEPPYIRVRSPNAGFLHLDGGFEDVGSQTSDNSSFTIGTQANRLYTRKIQRFTHAGIQLCLATPNINPRNNTIIVESAPGVLHTGTLPEGWYPGIDITVPAADNAFTALAIGLNSVVPPFPAVFVVTWTRSVINGASPLQGTISNDGAVPWRFYNHPSNTCLAKGRNLFNLPQDQNFTAIKTLGAANLLYSRYVDICSAALTRYSKNPTASNQGPFDLYARVYLQSPLAGSPGGFPMQAAAFAPFGATGEATNYRRDRAFEQVDIRLQDEFGDPFYIPSLATATPANVDPSVILLTEI